MNTRYQRRGDLYEMIAGQYGTANADRLAALDAAGETRGFSQLLSDLRRGNTGTQWGSESTLGNFADQITLDPLAAPLESANRQIANAVANVFKNPFVLLTVAALVFYLLGGFTWLKGILARKQ